MWHHGGWLLHVTYTSYSGSTSETDHCLGGDLGEAAPRATRPRTNVILHRQPVERYINLLVLSSNPHQFNTHRNQPNHTHQTTHFTLHATSTSTCRLQARPPANSTPPRAISKRPSAAPSGLPTCSRRARPSTVRGRPSTMLPVHRDTHRVPPIGSRGRRTRS